MSRFAISRAALLLVLVLVAVPAVQAAPDRAEAAPAPSASVDRNLFSQVWDFLTGVWNSSGCGFDPDGRCEPKPTTVDTDSGCGFDPDGRCRS